MLVFPLRCCHICVIDGGVDEAVCGGSDKGWRKGVGWSISCSYALGYC